MTEDEKQELRIKEGHRMLARAEQAKRDGQIKDYYIFVLESNPEVIDTIQLVK